MCTLILLDKTLWFGLTLDELVFHPASPAPVTPGTAGRMRSMRELGQVVAPSAGERYQLLNDRDKLIRQGKFLTRIANMTLHTGGHTFCWGTSVTESSTWYTNVPQLSTLSFV